MLKSIAGTKALITDIDRRKSLPIIQSLGRAGIKVIGISCIKYPLGAFSKYCLKVYYVPDYRYAPDLFLEKLEYICRLERPDVFYPIEDLVISLCLRNPNGWVPYTQVLLSEYDNLETAYDKWLTIKAAKKLNILAPITYCPKDMEEVKLIAKNWHGQAVIKPRKSSGSRGLSYVENPSNIPTVYQQVSQNFFQPLIQERIPSEGSGLGVFALINRNHEIMAIFGHKRLREYPVSGGPSTLCVSYRDDKLIEQSIALFREIGLIGVAMAEYKIDIRTQKATLMEINPRFWGSLQLSIFCGVNFPLLYHNFALGLNPEKVFQYPEGKYWRWLWPGDILHFLKNPDRFRLKPSFFEFRNPDVCYDMSLEDPLPIVGVVVGELFRFLKDRTAPTSTSTNAQSV